MKKVAILLVAAFLMCNMDCLAQASKTQTKVGGTAWESVWAEYNPSTFKIDKKNVDDLSFNGISIGYSKVLCLSEKNPVFFEIGAGLQYSYYDDSEEVQEIEYEEEGTMYSVKVPLNVLYKYDMPNSKFSLMPFAGLSLRGNLSGKIKRTATWEGTELKSESKNVFDEKDMGKKNCWNRFQLGWQIGVKARLTDKIMAGVSYGVDFSEIRSDIKITTTTLSLSYVL